MEKNKKKNIILGITTPFLFAALFSGWPYGFFTLLRFVVFAAAAYVAWMAYEHQKEKWVWISRCSLQSIFPNLSKSQFMEYY